MRRALLALALLAACLPDPFDPQVGAQLEESCVDSDSNPDVKVTYSNDVRPLFEEYCFRCHTPTGSAPIGLEVGKLDLSTYSSLRAGGAVSGSHIIEPGNPCRSALIEKVSEYPSFGARMPLNGPPFLEEEEIQLL